MTNTEPADTRPRCATCGHAWYDNETGGHGTAYCFVCKQACDYQPAPTPSGDGAQWRCSRCGERRAVTAVVGEGDEGVTCTVSPPCNGLVSCERNGVSDLHEPNETCPGPDGSAWCPFDGADDYGTQDVDAVIAIQSARKRGRAESAAALQEAREGWRLANEAAERLLPIANRAESAEQRLREVEAERDRLRLVVEVVADSDSDDRIGELKVDYVTVEPYPRTGLRNAARHILAARPVHGRTEG